MTEKEPEVQVIHPATLPTGPKKEENLKIGIGQQGGFVFIEFTSDVRKLIISKQQAKEFARRLIQETIK